VNECRDKDNNLIVCICLNHYIRKVALLDGHMLKVAHDVGRWPEDLVRNKTL